MPLTAAQICALSRQDARCPGFTSQSGQLLNMILSDLCQNYDFDVARQNVAFTFQPGQLNSQGQAYQNLPANYLRGIRNGSYYTISGVPYPMIPCDMVEEYNMLVEQAGLANFPVFYATDMSLTGVSNSPTGAGGALFPVMLFWEVPSGGYPANVYYFSQMPDIVTPETSNVVPWFPSQEFLRTELAGQLMKLTDDERADAFLSSDEDRHPGGSRVVLRRFLQLKDDKSTRVQQVQLDRRRFGTSFDRLRNTKSIGWVFAFLIACSLCWSHPAHAQKTPTALVSEVDLNLADNTSGLITPAIVRTTLIDIINSMLAVLASPAINSTFNSVYGTPTVSAGACGAGSNGSTASGSVNQSGQVDIGASATTFCVVTFVPALTSTPDACILFPQNATAAAAGTTVARVATATNAGFGIVGSALANANYWWHCF